MDDEKEVEFEVELGVYFRDATTLVVKAYSYDDAYRQVHRHCKYPEFLFTDGQLPEGIKLTGKMFTAEQLERGIYDAEIIDIREVKS